MGAYLGLAKAYNGGELGSPSEAPESVTYTISNLYPGIMSVYIQSAGGGTGYWTFSFAQEGVDLESDVTFSVDMTNEETHPDGVYLAGGGFGQDGILMDDSDGNDIWETTVSLAVGSTVTYKFRNQPSFGTWEGFEPQDGLAAGAVSYTHLPLPTILLV